MVVVWLCYRQRLCAELNADGPNKGRKLCHEANEGKCCVNTFFLFLRAFTARLGITRIKSRNVVSRVRMKCFNEIIGGTMAVKSESEEEVEGHRNDSLLLVHLSLSS